MMAEIPAAFSSTWAIRILDRLADTPILSRLGLKAFLKTERDRNGWTVILRDSSRRHTSRHRILPGNLRLDIHQSPRATSRILAHRNRRSARWFADTPRTSSAPSRSSGRIDPEHTKRGLTRERRPDSDIGWLPPTRRSRPHGKGVSLR